MKCWWNESAESVQRNQINEWNVWFDTKSANTHTYVAWSRPYFTNINNNNLKWSFAAGAQTPICLVAFFPLVKCGTANWWKTSFNEIKFQSFCLFCSATIHLVGRLKTFRKLSDKKFSVYLRSKLKSNTYESNWKWWRFVHLAKKHSAPTTSRWAHTHACKSEIIKIN